MIFKVAKPTIDQAALAQALQQFLSTELPRRQSLFDYYEGRQGVNKGRVAAGRPNNKLLVNYAKYITDVHTGYFIGLPPTLQFSGKRVQEKMLRALREADMESVLFHVARDMSICGEGYALAYLGGRGMQLARLDPRETFLLACGIDERPCGAVRLQVLPRGCAAGELYIPGAVRSWEYDGKEVHFGGTQPLPLGALPVSRFCNNLSCIGDFEPVCSLIDAYNVLLSGAMDDMQSVANAFLALYGMQGTTKEDIDRANLSRVLSLAENGKAEFVVKNLNPDAMALLQKSLIDDMLMITMTPNLNDEAFGTGSSGVQLEYKLWGAEQARSGKEKGFLGGLYHLVALFFEGQSLLGAPLSGECTARFYKNLPQDLQKLSENLHKLGDTISHKTKLELLPFIADAERELQQIKQEGARKQ